GCWLVESAAQRGRQRGDVVGADDAGAPRPISYPAAWRVPRCFQPGCGFLPRAGSGSVPAADRRSGCCAAASLASPREFAPAASIGTCLFRCLFDVGRGDAGAGARGAADETFGGWERRWGGGGVRHGRSGGRRRDGATSFVARCNLIREPLLQSAEFQAEWVILRRLECMTSIAAISYAGQRLRQPPRRSACWCLPMPRRRQPCRRRLNGTLGACGISYRR